MKRCGGCDRSLPELAFHKNAGRRDGLQTRCKECQAQTNRDARGKYDGVAASQRWRKKNPEKYRESLLRARLRREYGLSLEQFLSLSEAQNGRCKICGDSPKTRLVVDHDHATGAVRGLLCSNCNAGIGLLRDSSTVLRSALSYLEAR